MLNQKHTARLAVSRTGSEPPQRPFSTRTLIDDLATVASCLLLTVPSLSPAERQFLYDIRRDEARFPTRAIQRLMELSRRSSRPAHREKISEVIRKHSLPLDESLDVVAASIAETRAQGEADVAVHVFLHDRSPANRERAETALTEHCATMRTLLDVVKATAVRS